MKIKQKKRVRVKKTSMRRRKLVPASLLQCTVIQSRRRRRRKKSEFYCMDVGDINLVFNETPTVHFIIIM